jgi:hypothetical protein
VSPSTVLAHLAASSISQEKGVFLSVQHRRVIPSWYPLAFNLMFMTCHHPCSPSTNSFPFGQFGSYAPLILSAYLQFKQFTHRPTCRYLHLLNCGNRTLCIADTISHDRSMPILYMLDSASFDVVKIYILNSVHDYRRYHLRPFLDFILFIQCCHYYSIDCTVTWLTQCCSTHSSS